MSRFANQSGNVCVWDIKTSPIRFFLKKPESFLFQENIYETLNADGSFYHRNEVENKFATIEKGCSECINKLSQQKEDYILTAEDEVLLSIMLALQMVRLPVVKAMHDKIEFEHDYSETEKSVMKNAMYRMVLHSRQDGLDYLKQNGISISKDIENSLQGNTMIDEVASFILSNCFLYIIYPAENEFFSIADRPVLVDAFFDAKYIYPISPIHAVCCCLFETGTDKQRGKYIAIPDESVRKINQISFSSAERWLICNPDHQKRMMLYLGNT